MVDTTNAFKLNQQTITPISSPSNLRIPRNTEGVNSENMFSSIFNSAINSINTTNRYLSEAENEEIKLALGQTDNTHDLAVALQKASTTLQYTVAVRDKFLEAYKEIMNMQI